MHQDAFKNKFDDYEYCLFPSLKRVQGKLINFIKLQQHHLNNQNRNDIDIIKTNLFESDNYEVRKT